MKKKHIAGLLLVSIFIVGYLAYTTLKSANNNTDANETPKTTAATPTPKLAGFDKAAHSLTDPNSIWVIVNKHRPLQPTNYAPTDLVFPDVSQRVPNNESMRMRQIAAQATEKMFADAKTHNLDLEISSAHRSYNFQVSLYNGYVNSQGKAVADTQSARPGHSEHQTGLVVDIQPTSGKCHLDECFGEMNEGKWLAVNAYKYGFILRYPKDKQNVTGYIYEPWHFRYVGEELATEMHHKSFATLEEFFELGAAPNYL